MVVIPKHLDYLKRFADLDSGSVLDVGVSSIHPHRSLRGKNVLHLDLEKTPGVDVCGDARNLPFPRDSFDFVVCSHLLEHLESYEDANSVVVELKRVARKKIIIVVPELREVDLGPAYKNEHKIAFTKYLLVFLAGKINGLNVEYCGNHSIGFFGGLRGFFGMGDLVCVCSKQ